MTLPESHRMSAWENVTDVNRFLDSHFSIVDGAGDKYAKTPAWERLERFYESLGGQEIKAADE